MIDSVTEYMHVLANTIIFASAITLFMLFCHFLNQGNDIQVEEMRAKASVAMEDSTSYNESVVLTAGSRVISDILSQNENIDIYVDDIIISESDLEKMREHNAFYLEELYRKVDKNAEYLIKCSYDNTNSLIGVNYVKNR